VVSYEGTGCYFLDKLQTGVWRLEVYPDAIIVKDPYGRLRFGREVSRVLWHDWPMEINLPDLGGSFAIDAINKENDLHTKTEKGAFVIHPGVYLLKRSDVNVPNPEASVSFIAPKEKELPTTVVFEPIPEIASGRDFVVTATVCNSKLPDKVSLYLWQEPHHRFFGPATIEYPMQRQKGYTYSVKVPAEKFKKGLIQYCITVQDGEKAQSFPADIQGRPGDWDFSTEKLWETLVVDANIPIVLYDVSRDRDKLLFSQPWHGPRYSYDLVEGMTAGKLALLFEVPSLKDEPQDVSCKYIFGRATDGRLEDFSRFQTLCVRARAVEKTTTHFGITLTEKDGSSWVATIPITEQWQEICIPLSQFAAAKAAMLPRGWSGHNYWLEIPTNRGGQGDKLHIENVESMQISIGTRFLPAYKEGPLAIELENVSLKN
jgi:hypothetical protein